MSMTRPSVDAATCTECGEHEDNFTETDYTIDMDAGDENESKTEVISEVECSCGATGTIMVDSEGTHGSDNISFEDASWNEDSGEE